MPISLRVGQHVRFTAGSNETEHRGYVDDIHLSARGSIQDVWVMISAEDNRRYIASPEHITPITRRRP